MGDTKDCVACAEKILAEAKYCKHCQTVQSDPRFSAEFDESKAATRAQGDQGQDQISAVWTALKTSPLLQLTVGFFGATFLDSIFWLTWADPFGSTPLLDFRNFTEWFLPTVAVVLLFGAWRQRDERLLIWATVVGGFAAVALKLVINPIVSGFSGSVLQVLGIWNFRDFADFAASAMLAVVFFIRSRYVAEFGLPGQAPSRMAGAGPVSPNYGDQAHCGLCYSTAPVSSSVSSGRSCSVCGAAEKYLKF